MRGPYCTPALFTRLCGVVNSAETMGRASEANRFCGGARRYVRDAAQTDTHESMDWRALSAVFSIYLRPRGSIQTGVGDKCELCRIGPRAAR